MKILVVDTSTKFLCLGISDGNKTYEYRLETGIKLSSVLVPTIKRALDALGWQIGDIDCFACGVGPGSFTGVRIGLATIKGFSWALEKPIAGIPSLDTLSRNVLSAGNILDHGFVVPVIDAKRNLIYSAFYSVNSSNFKRITPYMLMNQDEFLCKLKMRSQKKNCIIFGDAVSLHKEAIQKRIREAIILDKDYWFPQPGNLLSVSRDFIKSKRVNSSFTIKPIYLYPQECQIKSKNK